jgi:hypothetical protein
MLGIERDVTSWERVPVPGGAHLGAVTPLFAKLEPEVLDD